MNITLSNQQQSTRLVSYIDSKQASPMSVSNSPNLQHSSSLTNLLKNHSIFSDIKRMSVEHNSVGALNCDEDTLENFYAKTLQHVKHLPNIKLAANPEINLSSSMTLPEEARKAFPAILTKIQQLIKQGYICNAESEKVVIYNYQHFSVIDETHEAYSLELSLVDIHDDSHDYHKGKIINLAIFADGRITSEASYLAILDNEETKPYGYYKQQGQGNISRTIGKTLTG